MPHHAVELHSEIQKKKKLLRYNSFEKLLCMFWRVCVVIVR